MASLTRVTFFGILTLSFKEGFLFVLIGWYVGRIAQLVEQWPLKPTVGGSNPSAPTE